MYEKGEAIKSAERESEGKKCGYRPGQGGVSVQAHLCVKATVQEHCKALYVLDESPVRLMCSV